MIVHLPVDLTSLPPFRELQTHLGAARALWVWWLAWRELAYLTQEGLAPGRIRGEDRPSFVSALAVSWEVQREGTFHTLESNSPSSELSGEAVWALLIQSRLLRADGPDWVCARFGLLHGQACETRSQAQRGGDARAFSLRQKRMESDATQLNLIAPNDKFKDEHGEPLDPETRLRITRLIVSCDNALFKNTRPVHGYTEGLIQDARRVLAAHSEEEINRVCKFVSAKRGHPALTTTEKLLPMFGDVVRVVEGMS